MVPVDRDGRDPEWVEVAATAFIPATPPRQPWHTASASASASDGNGCTVSTGPKISCCTTSSSWRMPVTIVASKKQPMSPCRRPPIAIDACDGSRSTNPCTRASWSGLFTGPKNASGSSGAPALA